MHGSAVHGSCMVPGIVYRACRRLSTEIVAEHAIVLRGSVSRALDCAQRNRNSAPQTTRLASMGWYREHVLPHLVQTSCSAAANRRQRQKLVPMAHGEVLEVGFGSGLNTPFYDESKVTKIWALEPSQAMRRMASPEVAQSGLEIEFLDLPGEEIPLDTSSVDTVLMTYTLCTIADTTAALSGIGRVLKPDGRLLFCEHGLSPDEDVRRWQNRLNPVWRKLAGGCQLNRDIPGLIKASGFQILTEERRYIEGPRPLCYNFMGTAGPQS